MQKKLAILDLDGTILDTLADLADAVNWALAQSDLAQRTEAEVRAFVGNGIRNLIDRSVPENTPADVTDCVFSDFKARYAQHCADKTCPYAGIPTLLDELRAAGVQLAVVSNKADFAVQELCARYFPGQIDLVAGEKAGIPKKPAPDSVNAVLAALNVPREQAVYVGDSEVDIRTACNAQMDVIIVSWGFRDRGSLEKEGAKIIVESVEELKRAIIG